MAAGNNPRQKMINLMYLVLIAMLALNVDTKVLKKFILINESFDNSVSSETSITTRVKTSIGKSIRFIMIK